MENSFQQGKSNEITVRQLIMMVSDLWHYLLARWWKIMLAGIIGAGIGFLVAWLTPAKYVSKLTFVVEEGKSGGGGLAALAGQFGFDIGGSAGGGFFAGDNILLFLKSENLCRETLMTFYDEEGLVTLADKYAEVYKMKKGWASSKEIGPINFTPYVNKKMPRLEDSLLQVIVRKHIILNDLAVAKPDKKASFIQVSVSMRDERLSGLFSDRLVKIATQKYVESKTKVKVANVAILQRRADSLAALLDQKTFNAALSQQSLVDMNPALRTAPINAEINTRDKTMVATIFAEVVKNLEISKTILSQETPVIQMVDQSSLPLEKIRAGRLKGMIAGSLIAGFLFVFFLLMRRWLKSQMQSQ